MQEIISQIRNGIPYPSSDEDRQVLLDNFKPNQLVRCKLYSVTKTMEPSVIANNLLHACINLVADNHPKYTTPDMVKFQVKVGIHYVDEKMVAVRPDGTVQFYYRSFGFKELKNMERLLVFDRAFDYLAGMIGITVDELIREAKGKMKSY